MLSIQYSAIRESYLFLLYVTSIVFCRSNLLAKTVKYPNRSRGYFTAFVLPEMSALSCQSDSFVQLG